MICKSGVLHSYIMDGGVFDNVKRIWTLKTVLDTGSFRKAASLLKVSPSAVSQSLSILETKYGKPLLIRGKNEIIPTKEAQLLIKEAEPLMEFLEAFDKQKKEFNIDYIDLGAYESLAITLFPELTKHMKQHFPKIKLRIFSGRSSQMVSKVRTGELCMAMVIETEEIQDLSKRELFQDRLGLFQIKDLKGPSLDLGVLSMTGKTQPLFYSRFLQAVKDKREVNFTADSFELLAHYAMAGEATVILPINVAARFNQLIEVTPFESIDLGVHSIQLVARPECDSQEIDFVFNQVTQVLTKSRLTPVI